MIKSEMTLNEFIYLSTAVDNGNGTFGVEITLSDMTKSVLIVYKCDNEYDAKERVFLYLLELINKQ